MHNTAKSAKANQAKPETNVDLAYFPTTSFSSCTPNEGTDAE